ncbi:MAG: CBS domain-containing protein [Desulfobulbaceae bacterium]|nr:MAG: CBS domain-containing protein [Desulfobulbaceae bacterium]
MFAVYNETGLQFRSTLEELYRVKQIKPVRGEHRQTHENEDQLSQTRPVENSAVNAYRKMIKAKHEEPIYHASQIMSRPVITIEDSSSVEDCYYLLEKHGIKQLPVVGKNGVPVGIISRENLLEVILVEDGVLRHVESNSLLSIISRPVITADPVADIRRVAKVMYAQSLNSIPITDSSDMFLGIITRTDIIKAVSTYPVITLWA